MSLQSQLATLISAIGADIKALQTSGGSTDPEVVRDTIGSALIPDTLHPGLIVTVDDTGNQIKLGFDQWVAFNFQGSKRVRYLIPKTGGNAYDSFGFLGGNVIGTLTAAAKTITNRHTRSSRVDSLVTTASATAIAGYRLAAASVVRGNAADVGGFYYATTFGPATGVTNASHRLFVGLRGLLTARTDTEPSADVNVLGVGYDAADTNFFMLCNDGAGACTKTDTGIACPTADRASWYMLEMWCAPNDTTVYYRFTDTISGTSFSGNFGTANIPANTQYLCEHWTMSVGAVSSVVGLAIGGCFEVAGEG